MSAAPSSVPWRAQATVKLVGRRREGLSKLTASMAAGASAVDAIDRAIELAVAEMDDRDSLRSRLDSVEDTLQAMDWQMRAEAAKVQAALSSIATSLAKLHRLIEEAAAADLGDSF